MAAHTPGPWFWHVDPQTKMVRLISRASMMPLVMGFERWGFNGACPEFRDAERDLMRGVQYWLTDDKVGGFFDIDHPDARLMKAAPDMYEALEAMLNKFDDAMDCGNADCKACRAVAKAKAALRRASGEA